ncbi:hypothetical protein [Nocardia nova]|uniref:hypothetical protein n=1 Tax=Nocardia nova TaxID=37330 RepID=UPI001E4442E7|nr:hypothetical protein [Nocardia nova]
MRQLRHRPTPGPHPRHHRRSPHRLAGDYRRLHQPEQRLLRQVNAVVSDGAASCLITTEPARIEILTATNQLIRAATNPDAIAALTRRTLIGLVDDVLSPANIDRTQIRQVITNNINTEALRFMTLSAGLDHSLSYLDNIADFAHVHTADNLVNLQSYPRRRRRARPDRPHHQSRLRHVGTRSPPGPLTRRNQGSSQAFQMRSMCKWAGTVPSSPSSG